MNHNRTRLEDTAQEHVQRHGLKGLSFRTLAGEVGIKSSSVHYYFPEKADLAQALIERYTESLAQSLSEISSREKNLRGNLEAFIGIFENVASQKKVCLCVMMAAELESLSENNKLALQAFFNFMEQWLVSRFERYSAELHSSTPPASLASMIISGLEGALLIDRVSGTSRCLNAQKSLFLSMV